MKKIALILVCILMTFACIAIAEEEPVVYTCGDYEYILQEDGTAEITDESGSSQKVEIPEKLNGYLVTSIGDRAFENRRALTEITIPDSVTSIGVNPFMECDKLTKIKVSPTHPTLATIDGVLFDKTEKKLICYPRAFTAKSYSIPQGISSIGDYAFHDCSSLRKITIPGSVTSIGDYAFYGCYGLTEITIPDSVTSIGANPFAYCLMLFQIKVSSKNQTLATIDGVLFDKTEKKLICYPCGFSAKSYLIPQGISSIGDSAFYCVESLTEIIIPDSVTSIGVRAFSGCTSLTEITIPDSVTSIVDEAFRSCSSLTEISIPDSVTSIGDYAFSSCRSLTEISIPDSVTSIGDFAFCWCRSLTESTIPDSVTFIGNHAFTDCDDVLTFTVEQNSYAEQYAKVNKINYVYPDSMDWLNS